ncbi:hypothetical protein POTTS_131 [Klebsiella phage vB_KpnM_Potts1]|uniref:Putative regulatory protein FmdB zinc ribbon domain-containing protein n=1 Tax=Klebsiella phage vB_KpnM_Potts1 TaxID=2591366 RepID=A0A5B9NMV6_9CAUD|nr:hypothetical protein POTTS_131 [Klebsiella phage vB_KpnM_Potts1]
MPTYDYKCEACDEEITCLRKISERDEPIQCPILCCEGKMHRTVSAPAVHYDGLKSGDY